MQAVSHEIPKSARDRRGTTVLEVIAAGAVLAVLLVVCAQMLSRTAVQQQAISNRRAALQMTANAMERVNALPWDGLTQDAAEEIASTVLAQEMLRGARLGVIVDEFDGMPAGRRILVTATWNEGNDGVERSQELTAWRYASTPSAGGEGDSAGSVPSREVDP